MSLLIESLCCIDGEIKNIQYHNQRLNRSRNNLFGCTNTIRLQDFISIPNYATNGIWKIRVHYSETISKMELELYKRKSIQSLQLVFDNNIDYTYKYADRSYLQKLFEMRDLADDILIIKNGFVTDTSFANVCFFNGKEWITPATPLLKGTKREKLMVEGIIREDIIHVKDIALFTHISLINAFLDPGDCMLPVSSIIRK